jgi:hypothetical protein
VKLFDKIGKSTDEHPSFIDRLLTATLAPIAFGFPIIIILAVLWGAGARIIRRNRLIDQVPVDLILLITIVLPAITGFVMGMSRFTMLYGHFFYTNMESEKDIRKTIVAWGCLFLTAYCITGVLA